MVSTSLFSYITPRSATLLLAVLGMIVHLNTYSWLTSLSQSFPDIPQAASPPPPPPPPPHNYASNPLNSAARVAQIVDFGSSPVDSNVDSNSDAAVRTPSFPSWVVEAKAYLKAQGLDVAPEHSRSKSHLKPVYGNDAKASATRTTLSSASPSLADAVLPASTSWQWFNLLLHNRNDDGYVYPNVDDGAEAAERMNWDAMRLVIRTFRAYIVLSVVCCIAGIIGVLRSQLLLSRLFVMHSFLDLLLSTLSLFALAVLCTYPSVRSHICDEFGSADLQSLFRPLDASGSSPSTQLNHRIGSARGDAGLPGSTPDVDAAPSGWETMIDGVFGSENCEETFRSTLVPLLMVVGLLYTALRLYCFLMVQKFYMSLLRTRILQYGYVPPSSGLSSPLDLHTRDRRWKEDKLLD